MTAVAEHEYSEYDDDITYSQPTLEEKREALNELIAWVENLRSGERKQGYGKLRSAEDRYCCVGVVTEQFIESRENFLFREIEKDAIAYRYTEFPNLEWAPNSIATVPAKIYYFFASRGVKIVWHELYELNDGDRNGVKHTFAEIADFIEKTYVNPLKDEING